MKINSEQKESLKRLYSADLLYLSNRFDDIKQVLEYKKALEDFTQKKQALEELFLNDGGEQGGIKSDWDCNSLYKTIIGEKQ